MVWKQLQGKGNVPFMPWSAQNTERTGPMQGRERLCGLLTYDDREAA
jgi:hypothetical protein